MEYEEALRKVQEACSRRGVTGIKDLGRTFRIYDGNKDRRLSYEDFSRGLDHYGCYLTEDEVRILFDRFDCDRNGTVDCGEFFYQIRPAMPRVVTSHNARGRCCRASASCRLSVVTVAKLAVFYNPQHF